MGRCGEGPVRKPRALETPFCPGAGLRHNRLTDEGLRKSVLALSACVRSFGALPLPLAQPNDDDDAAPLPTTIAATTTTPSAAAAAAATTTATVHCDNHHRFLVHQPQAEDWS